MQILPLHSDLIPQAAALFIDKYRLQRQVTPLLSDRWEDPNLVQQELVGLVNSNLGVAAVEGDRLLGYISAYRVLGFRDTSRCGAYVPEWGHAAPEGNRAKVYAAMYREASRMWAAAGCELHAITLLAHDQEGQKTWYWNGFGLTVVDAIRATGPLAARPCTTLKIRKAGLQDIPQLVLLDVEHRQHYLEPPVFMAPRPSLNSQDWEELITRAGNSAWLAVKDDEPAGFIRFDAHDFDGASITATESGVYISGAYIRPANRGQNAATAILDAALSDYANQGKSCCVVDFESFNPEAAAFWMKYFDPVCFSLLRVPETVPGER